LLQIRIKFDLESYSILCYTLTDLYSTCKDVTNNLTAPRAISSRPPTLKHVIVFRMATNASPRSVTTGANTRHTSLSHQRFLQTSLSHARSHLHKSCQDTGLETPLLQRLQSTMQPSPRSIRMSPISLANTLSSATTSTLWVRIN
jgi:hypothetical protein